MAVNHARRRPGRHPGTHRPALPTLLLPAVLVAVLASGCGTAAPQDTPSGAGSPTATSEEQTEMTPSTPSSPSGTARTAEELLDGLSTDLTAVTELLGGEWTRDGEPFDLVADTGALNPATCASGDYATADGMDGPLRFQLVLNGPGHADPQAALDGLEAWAADEGFSIVERGQGSGTGGDLFSTLDQQDGTRLTVNVSTERTKVGHYTACSEHPSLAERVNSDYTSPGDRFGTPTP